MCAAVGQLPEEFASVNVTVSTQAGTATGNYIPGTNELVCHNYAV